MDIFKVLRPLHRLTLLMARASYIETKNVNGIKEYKFCLILSIITFTFPFVPTIWTALGYNYIVKIQDKGFTFSNLAFVIHQLIYFITFLSNNILRFQYIDFINRLHSSDGKLIALKINPNDGSSYVMLLTFVVCEYFSLIGNIMAVLYFKRKFETIIPIFMGHIKDVVLIQAYSSVYLVYYRLKLINDRLSVIKKLYSDSSKHLKLALAREIRDLCEIQDILFVLRGIICEAFQIQIVGSIVSLVVYSLLLITETFKKFRSFDNETYTTMCIHAIFCNLCLFILTLACTKCMNQVGINFVRIIYYY